MRGGIGEKRCIQSLWGRGAEVNVKEKYYESPTGRPALFYYLKIRCIQHILSYFFILIFYNGKKNLFHQRRQIQGAKAHQQTTRATHTH